MQPEVVERLHQTSRVVLENPTVDDVVVPLPNDVEHNRSNPRELEESPKGSNEHGVFVEFLQVQKEHFVEHVDVQSGSPDGPLFVRSIDPSLVTPEAAERSLDGIENREHMAALDDGLAQTTSHVVHSNSRIQQDLELWRRVKVYDKKAAEEAFLPVLTRKQKQHLKKTNVGKPYKTRSTGDNSSIPQ